MTALSPPAPSNADSADTTRPCDKPTSAYAALRAEQERLEVEAAEQGRDKFLNRVRKSTDHGQAASRNPAGGTIVRRALPLVSAAITRLLDEAGNGGKPGPRHSCIKWLELIPDPDLAAYRALEAIVNCLLSRDDSSDASRKTVAFDIGSALELEVRLTRFKASKPGLFHWAENHTADSGPRHRRNVMRGIMRDQHDQWPHKEKIRVGLWLLEAFHRETGMITFEDRPWLGKPTKFKDCKYVVPTPATRKWITARIDRLADMHPCRWPMIVPPTPWEGMTGGGYLTAISSPQSLVTFRRATHNPLHRRMVERAIVRATDDGSMAAVYRAINAIQAVPWRVNRRVLDIAEHVYDLDNGLAGIPSTLNEAKPPQPDDIATNPAALEEWKARKTKWEKDRRRSGSKRLGYHNVLDVARRFADRDAIYFPHHCDFRGRMYPIPTPLSPQGNKLCKGLLTFAEGLPLTAPEHWSGLKRHGANCYGLDNLDKEPFHVREQWVDNNTAAIIRVAADPLGADKSLWTDADSPWQFLAFCFEWAAAVQHGDGFISTLPCYVDGTANGIQHFALMARCPDTARLVNLLPADRPSDIYQVVADAVVERLQAHVADKTEWCLFPVKHKTQKCDCVPSWLLAQEWLAWGVDRKLAKRPVMVLPYGGTIQSCRQYVEDVVNDRAMETGQPHPFGDKRRLFGATVYMSKVLWAAMEDKIRAARRCMEFFKGLAGITAAVGLPFEWTTPSGFPVVQAETKDERKRVTTVYAGEDVRIWWTAPTDEISLRDQKSAAAANVVHSFDAAMLALVVRNLAADGVAMLAVNHDSFGAVAADVPIVLDRLRKGFVETYYQRVRLGKMHEDVVSAIRAEEGAEDIIKQLGFPDVEAVVGHFAHLPTPGRLSEAECLNGDYGFN